MIERILIKDAPVFDTLELSPCAGLNIISGASGAGKSVLLECVLSLFGYAEAQAGLVEASIGGFESDSELVEDENILRCTKKEKLRYFLNDSQLSKRGLTEIFSKTVRYLHHKDKNDVTPAALLELLDLSLDARGQKVLQDFKAKFAEFSAQKDEFLELRSKQATLRDSADLIRERVQKINRIKPKSGEYERLLQLKKDLSKKEKLGEYLQEAYRVFDSERAVFACLEAADLDTNFISEAFGELRSKLDAINEKICDLGELDPGELLGRIEDLSSLVRTYGSEEAALDFAKENERDLQAGDELELELRQRKKKLDALEAALLKAAADLSALRKTALAKLEKRANEILQRLKIPLAKFLLRPKDLGTNGIDEFCLDLLGAGLSQMSSGEFNRFRLAVLVLRAQFEASSGGVLFFDEIDANVSGLEAEAIALLILELSRKYQIFAISHQPQLSSKALNHYLVEKRGQKSAVQLLSKDARVRELARMISGKEITKEALKHGEAMLKNQ
ncbi:MAG: AAA family ATPase [Helicobacteraceae bacterium]